MTFEHSSHSYFSLIHHLKRSALPKTPKSLIPPHPKSETAVAELDSHSCHAADPRVSGSLGENMHRKDFFSIQSPAAFSDCFFGAPEETQYFLPWGGFLLRNAL